MNHKASTVSRMLLHYESIAMQLYFVSMDCRVEVPEDIWRLICQRAAKENKSIEAVILEALARGLGLSVDVGKSTPPKLTAD